MYRLCFRWEDGYADDVEVTDYWHTPRSEEARAIAKLEPLSVDGAAR